jgi:hypothetical protein
LPELIETYKSYKKIEAVRDRFEIIAFHDYSARSIAEAYERLSATPIIKEKWGAAELPFPVLLDDSPFTIDGWGITGFPTTVLIDPEGKLVKGQAEALLGVELRRIISERKAEK